VGVSHPAIYLCVNLLKSNLGRVVLYPYEILAFFVSLQFIFHIAFEILQNIVSDSNHAH